MDLYMIVPRNMSLYKIRSNTLAFSLFLTFLFSRFQSEIDHSRRNNTFSLDAGTLGDLNYFSLRSSSSSKSSKHKLNIDHVLCIIFESKCQKIFNRKLNFLVRWDLRDDRWFVNRNNRKRLYLYSCTLNLAGVQVCCFEYRPARHLDGSFLSRRRHVSVSFPGHVPTHWPTFICYRKILKTIRSI